jgi:hypothetical protein
MTTIAGRPKSRLVSEPFQPTTPASAPPFFSTTKRVLFSGILIVFVLAVLEFLSYVAICCLLPRPPRRTTDIYREQSARVSALLDLTSPHHIELHPVLGWRYAPNYRNHVDHQMNALAVRSTREYSPVPPPGIVRIAAFGDSFVYGSEVDNANAWATLMEVQNPDLEVLNFGVGGFGVDQAYLRYRLEGMAVSPHVVLIGYSPDDINRVVNVFRRFLNDKDTVLAKPRYVLRSNGTLSLIDTPLPDRVAYQELLSDPRTIRRFGKYDHWYEPCQYDNALYDYSLTVRFGCSLASRAYRKYLDPEHPIAGQLYNPDSTAFKIQAALFSRFAETVREGGALPIVLLLPEDRSIVRSREGKSTIYEPLLTYLDAQRIDYVDAAEAFRLATPAVTVREWLAPGGHYSPTGNAIVASWLAKVVRKRLPAR